jgi:hypothetical protein
MSINSQLISFIKDAKDKGYEDFQIRDALLGNGWPSEEVEKAFSYLKLKPKSASKNRIQINIDDKVLKKLEKRAEKNMLNIHEQIEDILRRSVLNLKKSSAEEKVDDKFITFFSRKKK